MEPHAGYNQEDKNIKCTIKSINKYIDNNKISLNFVLLFENLDKNKQEIFLAYSKSDTSEHPGFTLPLNLHLQVYKEKFWWATGYNTILKSFPRFSISGESSKVIEFKISVRNQEYFKLPLRLKIQGHPVTAESWDGEINIGFSIPFIEGSQKGTRDIPVE